MSDVTSDDVAKLIVRLVTFSRTGHNQADVEGGGNVDSPGLTRIGHYQPDGTVTDWQSRLESVSLTLLQCPCFDSTTATQGVWPPHHEHDSRGNRVRNRPFYCRGSPDERIGRFGGQKTTLRAPSLLHGRFSAPWRGDAMGATAPKLKTASVAHARELKFENSDVVAEHHQLDILVGSLARSVAV